MVAGGLIAATTPAHAAPPLATAVVESDFKALIFSKTAGFRHGSIPSGIAAIEKLGVENNFEVDTTEDAESFTEENLAQYDVVIWLSTTGDALNEVQQTVFEEYIQAGGGYAGVHAASDTEYDWPWYGELVGAYFSGHPQNQTASITVEDFAHPSSAHLDETWDRFDEWYNFGTNPREDVHVLMSLEESSYEGGTMGVDHPIAWCQTYDGGRAWYTGGGHTNDSFEEADFLTHLLGGITTAAGAVASDCSATQSDSYELVTLDDNTENPMAMDIASDSTVFYAERNGRLQRIDGDTLQTTTALTLGVTLGNEDGLLGVVLDPDFDTNNWAYLYWAPEDVGDYGPHNRISRFTYDPASRTFDRDSEEVVLTVTTQRATCCHAGGDMLFDNDGNLVLATGDNTNPFESDGYSPIDERGGRSSYDARGTSANSNDLRGKLIRVTPTDDGSYTIPEGNLFPESADDADKTLPEIYAMGFRNPFRMGLDSFTNNLLVADYGPDAGSADANRGPGGTVEWNIVDEPGNYGWPLCVGITCYNSYEFGSDTSGPVFDANAPVNDSPNNTGLTVLPPVIVPEWWTENGATPIYEEIGRSGAPMGGPTYAFDEALESDTKWPAYWDRKAMFAEWNSGRMFSFQLNEASEEGAAEHTEIVNINRMLPGIFDPSQGFSRSMDFDFGPDGALYVIDWGSAFGGNSEDSGVFRVDYIQANPSPIARASADVTDGAGPSLDVQFSSEGTRHPVSKEFTLEWDFGDGSDKSAEQDPLHTYAANGDYNARLTVTDEDGRSAIANIRIVVGNALPTVTIDFPENGGFFTWGDDIAYEVTVNDPDGNVDCSEVRLVPALGHDSHNHDFGELAGCSGSFPTARDAGHGLEANLFWIVNASYTDDGGDVGVPLTGYASTMLNPTYMQAQFFSNTGRIGGVDGPDDGVRTEQTSDSAGGSQNVSNVEPGDWWSYDPMNLKGVDSVSVRLAKGSAGPGNLELRWNDPESGQLLGNIPFEPVLVDGEPDWQAYRDVVFEFGEDLPIETGTLYFVLTEGGVNVNFFEWAGDGVDSNSPPTVALSVSATGGQAPLVVNASVSAVDPEGTELSYRWDKGTGAGFQDGDTAASFTYEENGRFELRVRVTDADGGVTEQTQTITVASPAIEQCFDGRSDGFDGVALDTDRWNRSVRMNQDLQVIDGSLVIPASKTDIYGAGEGTVPNIVLQELPDGAFQATTKVSFEARDQYQQAGLVVYGNDDNYAKFVLQGRGTNSDAGQRIFQFIVEEDGEPNEVDASNTANLGVDFPDTFFVRMTSNGTDLTASYSADGITFTAMPQTKSIEGIEDPRIGVLAFANDGSAPDIIDASFDWFTITPDDTRSSVSPNDTFDGSALSGCRWTVLNEDATGYRVIDGMLEIDTGDGDIYGDGTPVSNLVLQQQPSGEDWVVETKVDGSALDRQYQQGGIILYGDDENYVKFDIVATNQAGSGATRNLELRSEIEGAVQNPQPNAPVPADGNVWIRLAKSGSTFTGWYSANGQDWEAIAETMVNEGLNDARIGLFALGSESQAGVSNTVSFDYFKVVVDEPIVVEAVIGEGAPVGLNEWFTGPVTIALGTTGGGESTVYREYSFTGLEGDWLEYTTPIPVTDDGEYTLFYRASTAGEQTDEVMLSFRIDATAPTVNAALEAALPSEIRMTVAVISALPTIGGPRTFVISANDATSLVDTVEYRIDGGQWITYTGAVSIDDTAQMVDYRATDFAGNVSSVGSLQIAAVGGPPVDDSDSTDVPEDIPGESTGAQAGTGDELAKTGYTDAGSIIAIGLMAMMLGLGLFMIRRTGRNAAL
jgi:cytochrome c